MPVFVTPSGRVKKDSEVQEFDAWVVRKYLLEPFAFDDSTVLNGGL
jgi:hypothetical protein